MFIKPFEALNTIFHHNVLQRIRTFCFRILKLGDQHKQVEGQVS